MKQNKRIVSILLLFFILFNCTTSVLSATINKALLYMTHYTEEYLYMSNGSRIKTAVVVYNNFGTEYPAYCVERLKDGVGEVPSYEVNIDGYVTDNGLWRLVTNAYPYRTPSEMGLNNADEAYFATKQAIYRYIDGQNTSFYAGALNDAGERILACMDNLLNIAYYGTATFNNATVQVSSTQTQVEIDSINSNYYSKVYSASTNYSASSYTVTLADNVPVGSYISDINGNPKTTFQASEKFKIMIPKTAVVSDINIDATIVASVNAKPLLYGEAYNTQLQDYLITGDPYEDARTTISLEVSNIYQKGIIKLRKIDKDTLESLAGARIQVKKISGEVIGEYITKSNGTIDVEVIEEGMYECIELEAPTRIYT